LDERGFEETKERERKRESNFRQNKRRRRRRLIESLFATPQNRRTFFPSQNSWMDNQG
jgi:hypothetical protein